MRNPATTSSTIVEHFSTFPHGGAARAAMRLHQSLPKFGLESRFVYHRDLYDTSDAAANQQQMQRLEFPRPDRAEEAQGYEWLKHRWTRLKGKRVHRLHHQHVAQRPANHDTYSMARLPYPTPMPTRAWQQRLLHLHWVSFFVDYPSFFASVPDDVPIAWTLHDMNAFTGGCHFSQTCERFQIGCGNCPQVAQPAAQDVSRDSFLAKQHALRNKTIHVIAPSEWMLELARRSPIWPTKTHFHKIHYGIDLARFRPEDKQQARKSLGISPTAKLLAFGADDLQNYRKGFRYLAEAINLIRRDHDVECMVFGSGELPSDFALPRCHQLGYLSEPEQLRQTYAAADIVMVPSLDDNQPQVCLEAMACGTPVVAFDAGGIKEVVRHEQTGLLATKADVTSLAEQVIRLLNNEPQRTALGQRARQMMEQEFEVETQTWQHASLYRKIMSQRTQSSSQRRAA